MMPVAAFTLSFSHEDPVTAMRVTSGLASKFLEQNVMLREQIVESTSEFLDVELKKAKVELERQESKIKQFNSQHLGELPQQMEPNLRALDRLANNLTNVTESIQRQSDRLERIEKGIVEYETTGILASELIASYGRPDPLITRIRELEGYLAFLTAEYKETYPDINLTRREIENVKMQLVEIYGPAAASLEDRRFDPYLRKLNNQRDELRSEIVLLKTRRDHLIMRMEDYEERVEKAPILEQELLVLFRDYDSMKKNYEALHTKKLNVRIAESLEKTKKGPQFRILEPANVPTRFYKPNQTRIMMAGLVLGGALGLGLTFMLEFFNPRFRRPEDVELHLESRVLATIPDFSFLYDRSTVRQIADALDAASPTSLPAISGRTKNRSDSEWMKSWRGRVSDGNGKGLSLQLSLVTKWRPRSVVAEQYRVAATRLALMRADRSATVVAVTSAVKGEGKTTTVVNLGYTLARDLGKRTLLIDCDFKCPMLHHYVDTPFEHGLADLLKGEISLDRCLSGFEGIPCWIMPVGRQGTQANEIFKTQRLGAILADLRGQFEYILINTPPILPLADMNVLAGLVDVLLLVVRAGSTPQEFVKQALNTLGTTIPTYIILNAVANDILPYYMYHYEYEHPPA